jgi:hypothetical protein
VKPVFVWLNVEVAQVVVLWHVEHCDVGKPAETWFGTVPPKVCVLVHAAWWHP